MPNLVWRTKMKVKEITITEAEITVKPLPGAQQLSVDGKPVGQANDPALAQQIAQATKDGKLTLNDPTKQPGQSQGAGIQEEPGNTPQSTPYYVDVSSGTPMAKTGGRGPTQIVPSTKWTAITPDIEAKADSQGFRKVNLQFNNRVFSGLEGGDMKLGSKIIVSPSDYKSLMGSMPAPKQTNQTNQPNPQQMTQPATPTAPNIKESEELLDIKKLSGL